MILLSLILTPLSAVFIFIKCIDLIYLFQIKEYRFDRINSTIKEKGVFQELYSRSIRFPSKSLRNIALTMCVAFTIGVLFLASYDVPFIDSIFSYGILIFPFISFVLVSFFVLLTSIPVRLFRELVIIQAKQKVSNYHTKFIGITGSYGKTSVKETLAGMLKTQFTTGKTPQNMNTDIGVAQSILRQLTDKTEYFVVEVGAYKRGEVEKASHYIPFSYAVLTGLGNQHVDLYGGREQLIKEESHLLYSVSEDGKVYIHESVPNRKTLIKELKSKVIVYGKHSQADIRYTLERLDEHGSKATITYHDLSVSVSIQLLGEHSVINMLPVVGIAHDLGIPKNRIKAYLESIKPIHGKISTHSGINGSLILNDASNSSVDGCKALIDVLALHKNKQLILVTQGILELGAEKGSSYKELLLKLEKNNITVYTTDIDFRNVCEKYSLSATIKTFNDVSGLEKDLKKNITTETVVGLEGKFKPTFIYSLGV